LHYISVLEILEILAQERIITMTKTSKKTKLLQQIEAYIDEASTEEISTFTHIMDGLQNVRSTNKMTLINGLLDMKGDMTDDETYVMTLPIRPLIGNSLNMVHGGITATLLDTAMGTLVTKRLPENQAAVTSEIKLNYIAPGVGRELTCIAKLVHKGNKICVTDGKIFNDEGTLVATGSGSFFVIQKR
jgi:uncharacterized protein (TIGR00369 family)